VAGNDNKREAEGGETDTTRFGMEQSDAEVPNATGGGVATGLQPGGMTPGGGPGATVGSLGTGGGSNANDATGDADENMIDEDVR
jgi:hypothetical protein